MNTERDKFLTEAMGECWHEWHYRVYGYYQAICRKCGREVKEAFDNDFSTWTGFGKLWEWAQKQEWWRKFWYHTSMPMLDGSNIAIPRDQQIIHPDNFANALYSSLRENKP
jgi:hypothetical protein